MAIGAIIFDMDDLMINSHPVHMKIFEAVLNRHGASIHNSSNPLSKDEEARFFGKKVIEVFNYFKAKYNLGVSPDALNHQFNELLLPVFKKKVEAMPGLCELINSLQGYRLVLASSAKRAKIDIVLERLCYTGRFDAVVSGEDEIRYGKPSPDIFLKAAEKIGYSSKNCLVLEDAQNGVEAAKAAGMHCIGVHNTFTFERLNLKQDLSMADLQVNSLSEITIKYIASI